MKIPLVYPKIPDGRNCPLKNCIAFEKLDGTNMHFIYKKGPFIGYNEETGEEEIIERHESIGWGTRRDRFVSPKEFIEAHPELKRLPETDVDFFIILNDYHLPSIDKYKNSKEYILFMEYCGPESFAGKHKEADTYKKLYLIDVQIDGRMLPPEEFLADFVGFENYMPKVIYKGKYTGQFVEDVRNGKYPVKEGVVCKGVVDGQVYMTKIKTNAYLEKLKIAFQDKWEDYWE